MVIVRRGWWAKVAATSVLLAGCGGQAPAPEAPRDRAVDVLLDRPAPDREARSEVKIPKLPKSASCRQAQSAYIESWRLEEGGQRADLTEGQFGMVLGRGHYLDSCRVPERYEVSICAAVQNGEVLGATVATAPRAPHIERCIDREVRGLDFPAHPRLDITRTVYRASR
jgi:hypothetical protein